MNTNAEHDKQTSREEEKTFQKLFYEPVPKFDPIPDLPHSHPSVESDQKLNSIDETQNSGCREPFMQEAKDADEDAKEVDGGTDLEAEDNDHDAKDDSHTEDDDASYERDTDSPDDSDDDDTFEFSEDSTSEEEDIDRQCDDTNETVYQKRMHILEKSHSEAGTDVEDWGNGFRIRAAMYEKLFQHQRQGVKWMWALHLQKAGGIVGDAMGLGKTAQVIAFLGGLHMSDCYYPSLVLCPVTLLRHWLDEVRRWYPYFRVCILHESTHRSRGRIPRPGRREQKRVIQTATKNKNGLLITTYEHLRIYAEELLEIEWGYAVLDEGHKIKNPDADITLIVKQNKLTELWSLFDFVFPGKLGTLPVFETEFGIPIQVGGYKNASKLSVSTAIKCASILRDIIMPYMLIRHKNQVMFCALSEEQRKMYKAYVVSPEVESIIKGRQRVLAGIDILRKICNHPDLLSPPDETGDYGTADRSGKLKVTLDILNLWKQQEDKVLVFTQTQMMLDILEYHLQQQGYLYYRMDGSTSIRTRNRLIESFNANDAIFAFLLTTKVGGLGLNLTGANRVLLYDPDWNPSVDVQARERAWRIGQTREVTIYRLITNGTIEEKIYQRQMFKQSLTNKVLKRGWQKRLFSSKGIRDLFTLEDGNQEQLSETRALIGTASTAAAPDCILGQLMEKGSVHCVLDQGAVDEAQLTDRQDVASYWATRAAEEAKERMETAGEQRRNFAVHDPTWTGKNGAAGAPPSFARALEFGLRCPDAPGVYALGAPSSSDVLRKLKMRNSTAIDDRVPMELTTASEGRSMTVKAHPLPQSTAPPPKRQKKTLMMPVASMALDDVAEEDRDRWKPQILEFFKRRGRVVGSDQLNGLATGIPVDKRPSFKCLVQSMANKLPGKERWVLHPQL